VWNVGCPCQALFAALLLKCERLQIAGSQKGLAWKAVAQPHLPMSLLVQRHRDWGCLLILPLETSNACGECGLSMPGSFRSPAPKLRMSADSWQPEGASLERSCSASSAHGTACTEAQRMGLLASLATSNFKRSLGMVVSLPGSFRSPAPKLRTSAGSWQPEGASLKICCSASSAHGTARTEPRDWGCLLVLPPQTSNVAWECWCPCQAPFASLLRKCERLQVAVSQKGLSWKSVAQPHLPMALLAQRQRDWGCLLVLPPQTSNVEGKLRGVPARLLSQPCSENANFFR